MDYELRMLKRGSLEAIQQIIQITGIAIAAKILNVTPEQIESAKEIPTFFAEETNDEWERPLGHPMSLR